LADEDKVAKTRVAAPVRAGSARNRMVAGGWSGGCQRAAAEVGADNRRLIKDGAMIAGASPVSDSRIQTWV
jgi:hypothetical protein